MCVCVCVHKTMLVQTKATEASHFTPHCSKGHNVSFSWPDCGQIPDNNWLAILKKQAQSREYFTADAPDCMISVVNTSFQIYVNCDMDPV